jgi:hypothetical protein
MHHQNNGHFRRINSHNTTTVACEITDDHENLATATLTHNIRQKKIHVIQCFS